MVLGKSILNVQKRGYIILLNSSGGPGVLKVFLEEGADLAGRVLCLAGTSVHRAFVAAQYIRIYGDIWGCGEGKGLWNSHRMLGFGFRILRFSVCLLLLRGQRGRGIAKTNFILSSLIRRPMLTA